MNNDCQARRRSNKVNIERHSNTVINPYGTSDLTLRHLLRSIGRRLLFALRRSPASVNSGSPDHWLCQHERTVLDALLSGA